MPVSAIIAAAVRAPWDDIALALAPWDDDLTLIEYQIAQLQSAGAGDIEVVLGWDAERAIPLVTGENVEPIVNATWASDAASTWRTGAAAVVRGTASALVINIAAPRPGVPLGKLIGRMRRGARSIKTRASRWSQA